MERTYLTEDIEQIKRYFPGARPVALSTPFDLTDATSPAGLTLVCDNYSLEDLIDTEPDWRDLLRWAL